MSAVTLSNCTETIFRTIKSGGAKLRSLLSNHEIKEDD